MSATDAPATPNGPAQPDAAAPTVSRGWSLRARVAVATALGALIITVALGALVLQAIERNNLREVDQQLENVVQLVATSPELAIRFFQVMGPSARFVLTVRDGDTVRMSTPVQLPVVPEGTQTVRVHGVPYRVTAVERPTGRVVTLGLPIADAETQTREQQRWAIGAGALAVAASGGLGWLFGWLAVRPIVELTRRIAAGAPLPKPSGVREAHELAVAVEDMLSRVSAAQSETSAALTTARDFAAVSAHELRTPLTAMRTDIEVLRTLDLDDAQRREILDDLQRTQSRVEATLAALERLASGELASENDYVTTDLVEIADVCAQDAMRHHPGLQVRVDSAASVPIRGLPVGLRLAVDNALSNAVRHGHATEAVISIATHHDSATASAAASHVGRGTWIVLTVDDNGSGVAEAERERAFERFFRGSSAAKGGSGLGLALVAQQAQVHGGRAYFTESPLGGARLVLELRSFPETR